MLAAMNVPYTVGSVLANKYRVDHVLGSGGMGYVLAATHIRLNERVAIKLLQPSMAGEEGLAARFLQEARAAAKIRSEHIVRVLDTDVLNDGTPYLVLEYLEGQDLDKAVRKLGPLPIPIAVEYVLQVCEALAEAHVAGVVHRDIKPANIFLTQRSDGSPLIKVLDFGISKVISDTDGSVNLTKTAEIRGSPLYMSPEQMRRPRDVDARSDVWSLGVVLFHLLTRSFPFFSDNTLDLCAKILRDEPVRLTQMRPDAPLGLEQVIERCLQKQQENRFVNVAELAVALIEFAPAGVRVSAERALRILSGNVGRASLPSLAALDTDARISAAPASVGPVSGRPSIGAVMGATPALGLAKTLDEQGNVRTVLGDSALATLPYKKPSRINRAVAAVAIGAFAIAGVVAVMTWGRVSADGANAVSAVPTTSAASGVPASEASEAPSEVPTTSAAPDVTPMQSAENNDVVAPVSAARADAGVDAGADGGVVNAGKKPVVKSGGPRRWR